MDNTNYVDALKRSLKKKISLLAAIDLQNRRQREILEDENSSVDDFQATVDEKSRLIDEIDELDVGFDEVFSRMKDEFEKNKSFYKDDIALMQDYIRQIMAKVSLIRTQEQENKSLLEQRISDSRSKSKTARVSRRMVDTYSKAMMGLDSMATHYGIDS